MILVAEGAQIIYNIKFQGEVWFPLMINSMMLLIHLVSNAFMWDIYDIPIYCPILRFHAFS